MAVPRFWRETGERYNLRGSICTNCDTTLFPSRSMCPECRHESIGKMKPLQFSGEGKVETFSVVHNAPAGFETQTPYVMAIVRLKEGPKVTGQIVDADAASVDVGMSVKAVFRRINEDGESGVIHYGYKFVRGGD